jgi:hypothetical protein
VLDARVADASHEVGGGEPAEQEHLADADQRGSDGVERLEITRHHVDRTGVCGAVRFPRQGPHRFMTCDEGPDELAAHVAGCAGDQDHGFASRVSTRVSPPVTSTTAPVIAGWS